MSILVTVDPGLRNSGVAIWAPGGNMLAATLARTSGKARGSYAFAAMGAAVFHATEDMLRTALNVSVEDVVLDLLIEDQQINYHRTKNPNDVLQVTGVAGAVAGYFEAKDAAESITSVLPEKWKRSVDKDAMTEMIRRRLIARGELRLVDSKVPPSLLHNTLDACGIGLWKFGQLEARHIVHRD